MAGSAASSELLSTLHNKATQLRINSVRATSEAGSGHPSSCASAADIVAALFFSVMRYDPHESKGAQQRPFHLVKRACGSAALCGVGGSRVSFHRMIS